MISAAARRRSRSGPGGRAATLQDRQRRHHPEAALRALLPALCLLTGLAACEPDAAPDAVAAGQPAPGVHRDTELAALFENYFEDYLRLYPSAATAIGDHRYDDRLEIAIATRHRAGQRDLAERYLAAAAAIDDASLSPQGRVDLGLFMKYRRNELADLAFPSHLLPFDQFNSMPNDFALLGSGQGVQPFRTAAEFDAFLGRIDDFAIWTDTAIENMRDGMRRGIVLPAVAVQRMIPQLAAQIVDRPEESLFYDPIRSMPAGIADADRERLATLYRAAIASSLVPAYRRLRDFLEREYLPAARPTVGLSELPGGDVWYDHVLAYHTTTDMDAEEIHDVGLREVNRILGEMDTVRHRVGFTGDRAAFFEHLKTDAAYFWPSGEEMLRDYRSIEATVASRMDEFFGLAPRAGFEIRPVEAFRAASAAGAEYKSPAADGSRPGVFYLNTHDLGRMPRWGSETLFLHEAIPGHHFQQAIALENDALPRFRRFGTASPWNAEGGVTAYAEGWALYAEDLGVEMGLLQDPYQYFGKLNDEMLRAMRLVVDTGIHRMGWSRQQAIDYMLANSSLPEGEVIAEVDRYIVWPGQALAYKIGQLELRRLRARAAAALGDGFDLRAWHDLVLSTGEVPLDVLAEQQRIWVARRTAG